MYVYMNIKRIIKNSSQNSSSNNENEKRTKRIQNKWFALMRMWTKVLNVNWSMPFMLDKIIVWMPMLIFVGIFQFSHWYFLCYRATEPPNCLYRLASAVISIQNPFLSFDLQKTKAKRLWINFIESRSSFYIWLLLLFLRLILS